MTQTTSHALEDKYNAEDDVKKIQKHAATKKAKEAVIIDNSNLTKEEQFEFMLNVAQKRMEI